MSNRPDSGGDATVSFSRLPRRGILLGLSAAQLTTAAVGLCILLTGLVTAGTWGLMVTAPLWVTAVVLTWVPVRGQPMIEWAPLCGGWLIRRATGGLRFRRHLDSTVAAGAIDLPGSPGRLVCSRTAMGHAVVHDPAGGRLVAIGRVSHHAFVLLDGAEQQRRVAGWARVLAAAGRSGRIGRVQISERTLPDTGTGLGDYWTRHGCADAPVVATTYAELIAAAGPTAERHETLVSVGLDLHRAASDIRAAGGGIAGATVVLGREMTALARSLDAADLGPVTWLSPTDVATHIRTAYDPAATPGATTRVSGAGPVGVDEEWDRLRADSGWHAVLWVSEWPRTQVGPGFLAPLLLTAGLRRTFTLRCDPIPTDTALRQIRRRRTEQIADADQRARLGQILDAHADAEHRDVLSQEADLANGHALIRYTGLLTVSATTSDELEAAVAEIEHAAVQAFIETRRLVGQQASSFAAAALPLCLDT